MSLDNSIETLLKQQDKKDEVHYGFIKQVLLMASGLLGILVSLHKTAETEDCTRMAFRLAIGLLALGILLLTIGLFAQVALYKDAYLKWKAEVQKQTLNSQYHPTLVLGKNSKIYRLGERIGYFSLVLSIISLTIYAMLIA